jgi:hypothetical protein
VPVAPDHRNVGQVKTDHQDCHEDGQDHHSPRTTEAAANFTAQDRILNKLDDCSFEFHAEIPLINLRERRRCYPFFPASFLFGVHEYNFAIGKNSPNKQSRGSRRSDESPEYPPGMHFFFWDDRVIKQDAVEDAKQMRSHPVAIGCSFTGS